MGLGGCPGKQSGRGTFGAVGGTAVTGVGL